MSPKDRLEKAGDALHRATHRVVEVTQNEAISRRSGRAETMKEVLKECLGEVKEAVKGIEEIIR